MHELNFKFVAGDNCVMWADVGSRVTCDPAPTDTDRDVLVLCKPGEVRGISDLIYLAGGELCGQGYGEFEDGYGILPVRLGDDNYLLTESAEYFWRFVAVTTFAKKMNFLDKAVRKELFAAALDCEQVAGVDVSVNVGELF